MMEKPAGRHPWCTWLATLGVAALCMGPSPARAGAIPPGVTLAGSYTGEIGRNYDPGLISSRLKTTYHDVLDLSLSVDTGEAGLWPGGTLYIEGMRIHGDQPSRFVIGDLQVASNIEAPEQTLIEEAWYEQKLMHGKLSLLAGLRDLNSDFYISEYAGLFLNSSFGNGPEISANVPASVYPKPGWTVRIRVQPTSQWYVQAADFDGDPQTRSLSVHEGQMWIAETGFVLPAARYKLGSWMHTGNKTYGGRVYKGDYGAYALVDQQLAEFGATKIGAFVQYGWVPPARNEVTRYLGLGLHVTGPIPARGEDEMGLALAQAATHTGTESTIELTYRALLAPHVSLQPSFQWIMHPGGAPAASTIRVGLVRFELAF